MTEHGASKEKCGVVSLNDAGAVAENQLLDLSDAEIKNRWVVAERIYPELSVSQVRLSGLSPELSIKWIELLVRSRTYLYGKQLEADMVVEYLADLCDANNELVEYGYELYTSGSQEELSIFVELCGVFGAHISKAKIIEYMEMEIIKVFQPEAGHFNKIIEDIGCGADQLKHIGDVNDSAGVDVLSDLKSSAIGRLYTNHVKSSPRLRKLVLAVWKNLCPAYIEWRHLKSRISPDHRLFRDQWYPLQKLSDYVRHENIQVRELIVPATVRVERPVVYPQNAESDIGVADGEHDFPGVYVAKINNVRVTGGTNLVRTADTVICHDLYDFKRDYTSEELHGRTRISVNKKKICFMSNDDEVIHMVEAASFVDAIAVNYAHWLTEVLPRIHAFCADDKNIGVPIIVDDGLHENIMQSLFLAAGKGREIVALPMGTVINVDVLHAVSVAGYVPFEPRGSRQTGDSDGVFSTAALARLRDFMHVFSNNFSNISWPGKIYLRRRSGARNATNSDEIEKIMVRKGYAVVDCAALTFLQQICLFSNADIIVGASGAAFANAIFSRSGTRAVVIISRHKDMVYGYWCNVLSAVGVSVTYLLGEICGGQDCGVHSDFNVDTSCLEQLLEDLESRH